MSLASDIQATVITLLNDPEYSRAATLRRVTPGTYDVATGTITPTTVDVSTRTLLMNYEDRYTDGETILTSDRRALLKGDIKPGPKEGDQLIVSGDVYEIINVKLIELAATNIVYAVQIRR